MIVDRIRLPLTIGIAAGMIKSFGKDWRGCVLDMLLDDTGKAMAEESESGLSPAEVIVARSVQELDENTQLLFQLLGIGNYHLEIPPTIVYIFHLSSRGLPCTDISCSAYLDKFARREAEGPSPTLADTKDGR